MDTLFNTLEYDLIENNAISNLDERLERENQKREAFLNQFVIVVTNVLKQLEQETINKEA